MGMAGKRVPMITADWRAAAACMNADPDLFFPISPSGRTLAQIARAKAICAGCLVRRQCLEYAVDNGPIYGIWGGTTPQERDSVRRRELRVRRAASRASVA
jgi:WhiB family redox-sensing transcriptional regulator